MWVNWEAMGRKYRKLVPFCGSRRDLNYLIGEMIGELSAGHTYVWGGDIPEDAEDVPIGYLGAAFAVDPGANYYRIDHIFAGTSWDERERSPLAGPGCPITSRQASMTS